MNKASSGKRYILSGAFNNLELNLSIIVLYYRIIQCFYCDILRSEATERIPE
jgi:hypothetical protein